MVRKYTSFLDTQSNITFFPSIRCENTNVMLDIVSHRWPNNSMTEMSPYATKIHLKSVFVQFCSEA